MKEELGVHVPIIRQYVYETESWLRMIGFISEETIYFRLRLADVVSTAVASEILEEAEKFQEDFLSQDRIVAYLSGEIHKQSQLLEKGSHPDEQFLKEIAARQQNIRKDIKKAEALFNGLKDQFLEFLQKQF